MMKIILSLLAAATLSVRAAEPISPQNSANTDARRAAASKSVFFTDTNRSFPILFIVGDSTVHNPQKTGLGHGWGDVIGKNFDPDKIRVENHASGGCSSRTFITRGFWQKVLDAAKPGDIVLLQLGHNDFFPLTTVETNRPWGTICSLGEETKDVHNPITKKTETVHTYGWYLRKYISEAKAKGMAIILCSPTAFCPKETGDTRKNDYVQLSAAVATAEKVPFINLNQITMNHYAGITPREIKEKYFTTNINDPVHTSLSGAELNAQSVIEGLKELKDCPLAGFLKAQ